ncbi:CPBP family intramembrane glutamic endopeptidase [Peptoniphilus obesi]|uniref:CPBP family intramembrane glutamic endopeptidase n=1 Tax=Peptoniphilus obesi TaxID=1472765 RepID=UPI0009DA6397
MFVFISKTKKINRNFAIFSAWILSSLLFGALHLSTYNYNFVQSIVLIGIVRLILSLAYIIRKNLWNSYLVHVLYDFIIIGAVLFYTGI